MPEYFFFTRGRELELLMYVLACGFLIWGADNYRRLAERLQKEEDLRKLVVEELAHRLKISELLRAKRLEFFSAGLTEVTQNIDGIAVDHLL